jgi:hypothetical protein
VRFALMLGIIIILNIFFNVIVALAYPAPDYNNYCQVQPMQPTSAPVDYTACQNSYQAASDQHALYAFVIMVVLGLVSLIVGLMPLGSSIVSSGLSYGGVLAFIIGSASYWGNAGNWVRLFISAVGLIALLYIGWRNFRD